MSSLSQGQAGQSSKPREHALYACTGQVLSAVDLRWDHGQEPEPKCPPARTPSQSKIRLPNLGQWRSKSAAAEPAEPHAHILLIDDDLANQQILEKKLTESGHRVTVVSSYCEAQRLVQSSPPEIILSDSHLEGQGGIEFTRWLRAQDSIATVPIVLMSPCDDGAMVAQGLEAGADDFLIKPVNARELNVRVRSLLCNKILTDELRAREQAAVPFADFMTPEGNGRSMPVRNSSKPLTLPAADHSEKAHVLVIEEQEPERALLQAYLEDIGCRIQAQSSPASAFHWLEQHVPDLVVFGAGFSDEESRELITRLKRDSRLSRVPTLAVSLRSTAHDRARTLELGADDAVISGYSRQELHARVRRLLRWKRQLDSLSQRCDFALSQAVADGQTGLFAHGFLQEMLKRALACARRHRQPLSLLLADIDHFKQINNKHGHAGGDRVLKAVADLMQETVRDSDTVARYGGDEFVALLPHTDAEGAGRLAERIRASIEQLAIEMPGDNDRTRLRITMSFGITSFPADAADAEKLLLCADEAVHSAKQLGRNRLVLFSNQHTPVLEQSRVLIVDDEENILRIFESYLAADGCQTIKARDGAEALDLARRIRPDLILLDAGIPHLSGYELCRRLKRDSATWLIPVILVSGSSGRENKLRGIEAGADDFLGKPVNREELVARVRSLLRSKRTTDLLEDAETVIFTLARAVESRDPSTGGHVERVSHYAVELGKAIGLTDTQLEGLRRAGVVHDIGKVTTPDAILLKPGKLTPEERKVIEQHAEVGYELLRPMRTFSESLAAVRFHHERLNGSGYPLGLRGDQIPKTAQVMAIADVYDALTTDRCYRAAMSQAEAFRILRDETAGGLHDPAIVETFIRLMSGELPDQAPEGNGSRIEIKAGSREAKQLSKLL